jgi:uncharacterized protein (TIGR04255 family)
MQAVAIVDTVPDEDIGGLGSPDLPNFEYPPVIEVVLGVEFEAYQLKAIDLGPLSALWISSFPHIEERPYLPPSTVGTQQPLLSFGPTQMNRHWWLSEDGAMLLQVQNDRFILNWRKRAADAEYPRYPALRQEFERRFDQFRAFVETTGKPLSVTQAEVTYINDLDMYGPAGSSPSDLLSFWKAPERHHLGEPDELQFAQVFRLTDVGDDSNLYLSFDPQNRQRDGARARLLTLTVRGTPAGPTPDDAYSFFDAARRHIVRSFTELTTTNMHDIWKLT